MVLLISTMWFGVMAMAYSLLVSSLFSQIINAWPNRKLLNYGYWEQLKDILPGILLAVLMGGCVNILRFLPLHQITILVLQIILGRYIYISCSVNILRFESFRIFVGNCEIICFKKQKKLVGEQKCEK